MTYAIESIEIENQALIDPQHCPDCAAYFVKHPNIPHVPTDEEIEKLETEDAK